MDRRVSLCTIDIHICKHIHKCIMCTLNKFRLKCRDCPATVHNAKLAIFSCFSAALDQDVKHLQQTLTAECLYCNHFPASISKVYIIDLITHLGTLSARVARQSRDSKFSLKRSKEKQIKDDEFSLCHQRHQKRCQKR